MKSSVLRSAVKGTSSKKEKKIPLKRLNFSLEKASITEFLPLVYPEAAGVSSGCFLMESLEIGAEGGELSSQEQLTQVAPARGENGSYF